jgi:hypothetical protein
VQGQLRGETLRFLVESECAHCGEPIQIEIDSALNYKVVQEKAKPLVFAPRVNFAKLKDPSIIDAF